MRPPFPTGKGAGGIGAQTPPLRTECGAHSCPAPARNGTTPRRGTQPRQPERQRNTPGQPRQASPRARTRRNSAGAGRKKRGRKPPHSPGARSARPPEARRASAPGGTRQPTRRTQGEPAPQRAPTPREGGANGGRANPRTSGGSTPRRKGGEPSRPKKTGLAGLQRRDTAQPQTHRRRDGRKSRGAGAEGGNGRGRRRPKRREGGRTSQRDRPGKRACSAATRHDPDPPARREVAKKGGGQTRPHTSPRQQRGARLSEGRSDPRPAAATAEGLGACAQAGEDGGRDAPQDEPARLPPGRGTGGRTPVRRSRTGVPSLRAECGAHSCPTPARNSERRTSADRQSGGVPLLDIRTVLSHPPYPGDAICPKMFTVYPVTKSLTSRRCTVTPAG